MKLNKLMLVLAGAFAVTVLLPASYAFCAAKMEAVDAKIADLRAKAEPRSAKETEQRLNAMRKREPAPPPDPELQTLLTDLQAQEARKKELTQALAAAVGEKVQESNKAVLEALDKAVAPAPVPAPAP